MIHKEELQKKRQQLNDIITKKEAITFLIERNSKAHANGQKIHFPFVAVATENTPDNKVGW